MVFGQITDIKRPDIQPAGYLVQLYLKPFLYGQSISNLVVIIFISSFHIPLTEFTYIPGPFVFKKPRLDEDEELDSMDYGEVPMDQVYADDEYDEY